MTKIAKQRLFNLLHLSASICVSQARSQQTEHGTSSDFSAHSSLPMMKRRNQFGPLTHLTSRLGTLPLPVNQGE